MAYTLTEDKGVDLPDTGAWTLMRTKDAKRQRVCNSVLGVVVRVFSLASGVPKAMERRNIENAYHAWNAENARHAR